MILKKCFHLAKSINVLIFENGWDPNVMFSAS